MYLNFNLVYRHYDETHEVCDIFDTVQTLTWEENMVTTAVERTLFKNTIGQPSGKRSLERPNREWVDNVDRDLRIHEFAMGWGYVYGKVKKDHCRDFEPGVSIELI